MARFGTYFIIAGALSGVLSLFDYELSLLLWIETWGSGVAWLIRGAFILVGMGLCVGAMRMRRMGQRFSAFTQQFPPR